MGVFSNIDKNIIEMVFLATIQFRLTSTKLENWNKNTLNQDLKTPVISHREQFTIQYLCNFFWCTSKCSLIYTINTKIYFLGNITDGWWSGLRLKLVLLCLASPFKNFQSHSQSFNGYHVLSFNKYRFVRTLWIRCHIWNQPSLVLCTSIFIKALSLKDCQPRLKSHSTAHEVETSTYHASYWCSKGLWGNT